METATIMRLSEEVRSHLRSGIAITSLTQCIEELVLNSIDAGATCIAVRVDVPSHKVQVVDNGSGINRNQMQIIGERYATSKCHSVQDLDNLRYYGFRGEALASIRDVTGVFEIVSKTKSCDVTFCKLFKNGKPLDVFEAKQPRPSTGTTITVHDFFFNLPVRRKTMVPALEFERSRHCIESIALMQPSVSFTLRNDYTGVKALQTRKSTSVLGTLGQIFGMAKAKVMKEACYSHDTFKITGYIGTEGHINKNIQFIYINGRLILKTKLHKLANLLLSKSIIVKSKAAFNNSVSPRARESGSGVAEFTNSPRYSDLHAMFVLDIQCPLSEYDICLEPAKTLVEFRDWDGALLCMENLILEFLKKENLTMKVDMPTDLAELEALLSDEENTVDVSEQDNVEGDHENLSQEEQQSKYNFSMFARDSACTEKYGDGISTLNYTNILQSLPAKRRHSDMNNDNKNSESQKNDDLMRNEGDGNQDDLIDKGSKDKEEAGSTECNKDVGLTSVKDDMMNDCSVSHDNDDDTTVIQVREVERDSVGNNSNFDGEILRSKTVSESNDTGNSIQTSNIDDDVQDALTPKSCTEETLDLASKSKEQGSMLSCKATELLQETKTKVDSAPIHSRSQLRNIETTSSMKVLYDKLKNAQQKSATERSATHRQVALKNYANSLQQFKRTVNSTSSSAMINVDKGDASKTEISLSAFRNNLSSTKSVVPSVGHASTSAAVSQFTTRKPIMLGSSFGLGLRSKFPQAKSEDLSLETTLKQNTNEQLQKDMRQSKRKEIHDLNEGIITSLRNDSTQQKKSLSEKSSRVTEDMEHEQISVPTIQSLPSIQTVKRSKVVLGKLSQKIAMKKKSDSESYPIKQSASSSTRRSIAPTCDEPARKKFATTESFLQTADSSVCLSAGENKRTDDSAVEPMKQIITFGTTLTQLQENEVTEHQTSTCGKTGEMSQRSVGDTTISCEVLQCDENIQETESVMKDNATGNCVELDDCVVRSSNVSMMECPESEITAGQVDLPLKASFCQDTAETGDCYDTTEEEVLTQKFEDEEMHVETKTNAKIADESLDDPNVQNTDKIESVDSPNTADNNTDDNELETLSEQTNCINTSQNTNEQSNSDDSAAVSSVQELGNNWISKFDDRLGRMLYIYLKTGETRFEEPSKEELQWKEDIWTETGASSSICTSMNKPDDAHRVHPYLSHGATPFLPKKWKDSQTKSEDEVMEGGSSREIREKSYVSHMWEEHVESQSDDVASKWRNDKRYEADENAGKMEEIFQDWQNPMFSVPETSILDANTANQPFSRGAVQIRGTINQYKFTKDMLDTIQVLGQADDKFIACLLDCDQSSQANLLVLIDQHAAHERVRLEQLTQNVFENSTNDAGISKSQIKSSIVTPPVKISLSAGEIRVLEAFQSSVNRLGINFDVCNDDDDDDGGSGIEISSLPACLVEREANELRRGRQPVVLSIVEALLKEHIDLLQQTSGVCAVLPRTLTKVLNSQACHGAIKFGDPLQHRECLSLIKSLSLCDLPFQCAHGRPSLMPIIDLKILEKQLETKEKPKPKLWRLREMMEASITEEQDELME
ncbi:DNA mismatch repair protein Mlh3-like [Glandiceps talaboti]